jgi:anti-sigma regulatory factor (Ser/Thr protein kinase)
LVALPALPTSARPIRQRLRGWLDAWNWPDDDLDDIIMAVDEAVANVVDHAYRTQPALGDVHVYAWITALVPEQRMSVSVTDRGRWRHWLLANYPEKRQSQPPVCRAATEVVAGGSWGQVVPTGGSCPPIR